MAILCFILLKLDFIFVKSSFNFCNIIIGIGGMDNKKEVSAFSYTRNTI